MIVVNESSKAKVYKGKY